jgi:hypothetical protein
MANSRGEMSKLFRIFVIFGWMRFLWRIPPHPAILRKVFILYELGLYLYCGLLIINGLYRCLFVKY